MKLGNGYRAVICLTCDGVGCKACDWSGETIHRMTYMEAFGSGLTVRLRSNHAITYRQDDDGRILRQGAYEKHEQDITRVAVNWVQDPIGADWEVVQMNVTHTVFFKRSNRSKTFESMFVSDESAKRILQTRHRLSDFQEKLLSLTEMTTMQRAWLHFYANGLDSGVEAALSKFAKENLVA